MRVLVMAASRALHPRAASSHRRPFALTLPPSTHRRYQPGSLMYMSPEVFKGENYNEKPDVFSFGVILY